MLYCVLPIQLLFGVKSTYYIRALSILSINCLNNYDSYTYYVRHDALDDALDSSQSPEGRYDTILKSRLPRGGPRFAAHHTHIPMSRAYFYCTRVKSCIM